MERVGAAKCPAKRWYIRSSPPGKSHPEAMTGLRLGF
jgi:hypothetical protein